MCRTQVRDYYYVEVKHVREVTSSRQSTFNIYRDFEGNLERIIADPFGISASLVPKTEHQLHCELIRGGHRIAGYPSDCPRSSVIFSPREIDASATSCGNSSTSTWVIIKKSTGGAISTAA